MSEEHEVRGHRCLTALPETPKRLATVGTMLLAVATLSAQESRPAAVPADAITAIIDAFKTHEVVALGEGPHGNEQGHAFRLALIRDPRFTAVVRDVIVECGNARHQALLDQFVRGDSVDEQAFREVLLDSSIETPACDRPIYGDFYRAVRDLNRELPVGRQLRVWFGAPPVRWATTRTRAQYLRQTRYGGGFRDAFTVDLFVREVRARGRRALIVYGDGHFQARHERPARSLLARLDAAGIPTFAVSNAFRDLSHIQPDVTTWPAPSIAMLRGTSIGAKPFTLFYGALPPGAKWRIPLEDHFDAMLYLGPPATMTMSRLSPELCKDPAYLKERERRLQFMPAGAGKGIVQALRMYCAAQPQ